MNGIAFLGIVVVSLIILGAIIYLIIYLIRKYVTIEPDVVTGNIVSGNTIALSLLRNSGKQCVDAKNNINCNADAIPGRGNFTIVKVDAKQDKVIRNNDIISLVSLDTGNACALNNAIWNCDPNTDLPTNTKQFKINIVNANNTIPSGNIPLNSPQNIVLSSVATNKYCTYNSTITPSLICSIAEPTSDGIFIISNISVVS